jgi:hypothetical protein
MTVKRGGVCRMYIISAIEQIGCNICYSTHYTHTAVCEDTELLWDRLREISSKGNKLAIFKTRC